MNKAEFLEKMRVLREQKHQYERDYIKDNMTFPEGVKIKVMKKKAVMFGIVKAYVVENDEVVPFVHFLRKDGTEGEKRLPINPEDKVEIAD